MRFEKPLNTTKIEARLTELGMTRGSLAAALGINASTLWRQLTRSGGRPKPIFVLALSGILGLPPSELTGEPAVHCARCRAEILKKIS